MRQEALQDIEEEKKRHEDEDDIAENSFIGRLKSASSNNQFDPDNILLNRMKSMNPDQQLQQMNSIYKNQDGL